MSQEVNIFNKESYHDELVSKFLSTLYISTPTSAYVRMCVRVRVHMNAHMLACIQTKTGMINKGEDYIILCMLFL